MAPSASMNIPYEPPPVSKRTTLQNDVQRLVKQKGPFHTVSEQGLVADINRPVTVDEVKDSEDSTAGDESEQSTRERLFQAREEIYQGIANVQQQLLTLIDTLSSAVASHSKIGQSAISPALRQVAPVGSVQTKQVEPKKSPSKSAIQRLNDISTVSRAQSFDAASEKLVVASRRLESEARHQARYWEQMATLRTNGWPISRLPNNDRALVVHFGSAESSLQYRNSGISVLRQDERGDLLLPGQLSIRQQKTLSVRVHRKGQVTGLFHYDHEHNTKDLRIEQNLLRARNSLFHQELFDEASKEARVIANMGVKARSSSIEIEIAPEYSIILRYSLPSSSKSAEVHDDDDLAAFVGTALRLMLVVEHQQKNVQRSQQKPAPLTLNPRPSAEYALLRPVIAHLRHRNIITPLIDIVRQYQKALAFADVSGLDISESESHSFDGHGELGAFKRPVSSEVFIKLPSQKNLVVRVETYLASPLFGTQISPVTYDSACGSTSSAQSNSLSEIIRFIEDVIAKEVGCRLIQSQQEKSSLVQTKTYPLVLLMKKEEDIRASLAVTCKDGTVYLQCTKRKDRSVLKAQWNQDGFSHIPKIGQTDATSSLQDLFISWNSGL